ncbi:hypothetical protein [Erythrobacter sp. Alg231-14]|uniref:hypothetical protein n=1 Tax=Erythrobacter sp. Alg231-14 TaxID=1922225 RepID=UPI000D555267
MYSIIADSRQRRLTLTFSGEMDQDPAAFFEELTSKVQRLRAAGDDWDLLTDFSDTPVMPQDRAQNTVRIFAWFMDNGMRRGACVLQSVTQRMQIARVTGRNDAVVFFDTLSKAESWLNNPAKTEPALG